jgi:hypothetical protein
VEPSNAGAFIAAIASEVDEIVPYEGLTSHSWQT